MSVMNKISGYAGLSKLLGRSASGEPAVASQAALPGDPADPADEPSGDTTEVVPDQSDPTPDDVHVDPAADPVPDDVDGDGASANTDSADYRAGVDATNRRWATVFASEHARNNMELATDLLAGPTDATEIVRMCERHGGKQAAQPSTVQRLLDATPKPKVNAQQPHEPATDGAAARKKAAHNTNARLAGGRRGSAGRRAREAAGNKSA